MSKLLKISGFIILIISISIYKYIGNNKEILNIDTISIPQYDFDTYTVITNIQKIFVIDELGNILDEYNIENTIRTYDISKKYNSNQMWFRSSNHDKNALKYNLFGYYDLENNEFEYTEYYYGSIQNSNALIESPLFLNSPDKERYKLYSRINGLYLYDAN